METTENRIIELFDCDANFVLSRFRGCPALDRLRNGEHLFPLPSEEDGKKTDALYRKYMNSGKSSDLDAARISAFRSVHVSSVKYQQAVALCTLGAAISKVNTNVTDANYQSHKAMGILSEKAADKQKALGKWDAFFLSVAANTEVRGAIGIDDTDTLGVIATAATHCGFRACMTTSEYVPRMVHNIRMLLPVPFIPRDVSSGATYSWMHLPPRPSTATMGAIETVSTSDLVTAKKSDETPTVQPVPDTRPVLSSASIAAFVVNCDYMCLSACDADTKGACHKRLEWLKPAKNEPHPLDKCVKHVIDTKHRLDALESGKVFPHVIALCVPSMRSAARVAREVTKEFKSQNLDISTFDLEHDGVAMFIRPGHGDTKDAHTGHLRAAHLAAAIYAMEFDRQIYHQNMLFACAPIPDLSAEFYARQYISARARTLCNRASLYVNGKFVQLVKVIGAYFTHAEKLVKGIINKTKKESKSKSDDVRKTAPPPPSQEGGGGEQKKQKRQRDRAQKRKDRSGDGKSSEPSQMGCVSCTDGSGGSVSDLYRSNEAAS